MWISNFAIRNSVITVALVLALVVFGGVALLTLDTDEFPEVQPPIINVSIPYPGASPRVVERELVDQLEDAFASISGVDKIESISLDSFAILTVEFIFAKDLNQASQDIRDKISEIRRDLPTEIEEPVVTRFDPNELPIVSLTLSSQTLDAARLTRIADPKLTSALRGIAGVADVELVGGRERELRVDLHPRALQATQVSVLDVVRALENQNLAAPVGRLEDPARERSVRLQGRLAGPEEFGRVVVKQDRFHLVRLADVATVRDGAEDERTAAFYSGKRAVGIDIIKAKGYSTTDVAERVLAQLNPLRAELPPEVELRLVRNAGERVADSVADVQRTLLEGAALTVLVVFVFLSSWRSTIITGLALPVSVLASFIAVWAFGFTLNTMSLLGLSLAIGILIDDAIVVRENIVRHMEMGKNHVKAAQEGTSEIGLAVAATTFSIVVVFIPVAFMGGLAEQWFAPFALTIAASVLVSLFVSFSLDPMLSAVWSDPEVESDQKTWLTRRLDRFNQWLERQTGRYKRIVAWALRNRVATLSIALVSFGGALAMPATGIIGSAFFPEEDRSEFYMLVETPPAASLAYTTTKALKAAALAREDEDVLYTYTTVGSEGEIVNEARIYVRLRPKSARERSQSEISRALRAQVSRLGATRVALEASGLDQQKQIQLQLKGPQLQALTELAGDIAEVVRDVPGAVDVGLSTKGAKAELLVTVDRALAANLGLPVAQIARTLRPAFAGLEVGDWLDPAGELREVVVRVAEPARARIGDLARIPLSVPSPANAGATTTLPLEQVATIQRDRGPAQIQHLDRERVVVIGANAQGRALSAVVGDIRARLRGLDLPPGYNITEGGETEDQQEVFGRILVALGVAVMLMYVVLVIQFGSFVDPLPIMASLPLSLIGVMLALLVTGSTLNIMSMIGVILLIGIVAKNAILLIDFAKWAQEAGIERQEAIIEAGGVRLRPILMTSFAIIAGMTPVALGIGEGAEFRAPLGRAVIGGIITSTVLTLLVIPTFYDILAGGRQRLRQRWQKHQRRRG